MILLQDVNLFLKIQSLCLHKGRAYQNQQIKSTQCKYNQCLRTFMSQRFCVVVYYLERLNNIIKLYLSNYV